MKPSLPIALLLASLGGSGCDSGGAPAGICRDPAPSSDALRRGPVVAALSPSDALISWQTHDEQPTQAEYRAADGSWVPLSAARAATEHRLDLRGLRPETRYEYQLRNADGTIAAARSFRTAPTREGGPFGFAVIGDSGGGCGPQLEVASRLELAQPDFLLHTGDVLYTKDPADVDPLFFRPYRELLGSIPFFLAVGNHDLDTILLDVVEMPSNDADGSERFYSFDWGNAHFVALDSNGPMAPGSLQGRWLADDLARVRADWTFVFFHHAPYSSSRGGNAAIAAALEPLFAAHGVDLVLSGHDHDYERTFPLRGGMVVDEAQEPAFTDPRGTVYVVTGGGGRSLYPSGKSPFTAYSESSYHLTQIQIDGLSLRLQAVRTDGSVLDAMTIHKTHGRG